MILIITANQDFTTTIFIDWLLHLSIKYHVLNEKSILKIIKIDINKSEYIVETTQGILRLHEIDVILIRKGELHFENIGMEIDVLFGDRIKKYFQQELIVVKNFLQFIFLKKKYFNSFFTQSINKLIALSLAKDVGLQIPTTIITSKKKELKQFFDDKDVITKALHEALFITQTNSREFIKNYTSTVNKEDLGKITDTFFPSLFQNKIEKKYELRIFYFANQCYASAIFSQQSSQTKVDFRNYNEEKPNRVIPYKLPIIIENRIKKFMKVCNLTTGSIDMAVDTFDNYIFFEVNPVGQFGMVAEPCNYPIENIIIDYLINP
jgi:ATP-GRASP peptide maturase of grasp-with-spasm system